LLFAKDRII